MFPLLLEVNKRGCCFQLLSLEKTFLFCAGKTYSVEMSENHSKLDEIINATRELRSKNRRSLAVFDLDSTLFNVSTRTYQILLEFAELYHLPALKTVGVLASDWGIKEAVLRAGFTIEKDREMLSQLRDFWRERFFSNEYIHYDVPYAGAISFVLELSESGCDILYLTARDQARMGKGSAEVLKKWGFPCAEGQLILKPERTIDDELFKNDWFLQFDRSPFSKIYFFENEPVNINAVSKSCPDIEIIFLETTHARKQEVTLPLSRIKHFGRG